jgi:transcriptional regulator GlxA family with amidase domain
MKRNVAILIFDEVEVLNFAGPFEVFTVTDELRGHDAYRVLTVAATERVVRARHGLKIVPDFTCSNCPPPHLLVVPGGFGTRALLQQASVLEWIRWKARDAELVMSVCTGSVVLGKAGVLDGLGATTHHECFGLLREAAPAAVVVEHQRFVDNGRVLTAAGVSAGIDCSLHVVARQFGAETAANTARYMEYRRP